VPECAETAVAMKISMLARLAPVADVAEQVLPIGRMRISVRPACQELFGDEPASGAGIGGQRAGLHLDRIDGRDAYRIGEELRPELIPLIGDIVEVASRARAHRGMIPGRCLKGVKTPIPGSNRG
jgi:hypothetical protein